MTNIWDKYPNTRSTSARTYAERVCASCPSKEYTMTYYRGRDRDDWRDLTFKAWSLDHALERATMELCPDGWTVKIVQQTNNQ